jgi:UDP-N-acetylglucosamine 1-carboxyvinyltransferase
VQNVCEFLVKCGAKIKGIGTHTLEITGTKNLKAVKHAVRGDYLEVGTFAVAAAVTGGSLQIEGGEPHDLDIFWEKLEEAGVPFKITGKKIWVGSAKKYNAIEKLDTGVFPKFPTDLQAPFGVLLTQCEGGSKIFETLFEGRLAYLYELEKMNAKVDIKGAHEAVVCGRTALKGASVSSFDLRAGAAMLLAGLAAKGETEVHAINYLDRGYEKIEKKLEKVGAEIKRVQ